MKMMNRLGLVAVLGGVVVSSAACGADGEGASGSPEATSIPEDEARESSAELVVFATGDESKALGLARWEVAGDGIRGASADDRVLAEFVLHPEDGVIESVVPSAGVRSLDGSAEPAQFAPDTERFFAAFERDRAEVSGLLPNASVLPSTFIGCNSSFRECNENAAVQIGLGGFTSCTCTETESFPCGIPGGAGFQLDCF